MPLKQNISSLEEQLNDCNTLINNLKSDNNIMNEQIENYKANILELEKLVETHQSENNVLKIDNKNEMENKNREIENLKTQIESEKREILQNIDIKNDELLKERTENKFEMEKLIAENNKLLSLLNTEKNDIEIVRSELEIKSTKVSQLTVQIDLLNEQHNNIVEELEKKNNEINLLMFDRENLKTDSKQIQSLKEQVLDLEKELKLITTKLDNRNIEFEGLKESHKDLLIKKENMTKEKESFSNLLTSKYNSMEKIIDSLQISCESHEKYDELLEENIRLKNISDDLTVKHENLQLMSCDTEKRNEELLTLKAKFMEHLAVTEEENNVRINLLAMKDDKISSLENDLTKLVQSMNEKNGENKSIIDNWQEKCNKLSKENDKLLKTIKESKDEIEKRYVALSDFNDVKSKFDKLLIEFDIISKQNNVDENLTSNYNEKLIIIEKLESEIISLRSSIDLINTSLISITKEKCNLEEIIAKFEETCKEKDNEMLKLKSDFNDREQRILEFEKQLQTEQNMTTIVSDNEVTITENKSLITNQQKQIKTLENDVSNMKKQIQLITDKFGEEKESLEKDLKDNENIIKSLKSTIQSKEDERETLQKTKDNEILSIQAALTLSRNENKDLLSEMKEINQIFKERGGIISMQQSTISEMESKVSDLQEMIKKNNDILNEMEKLKSELCKYKKMCEDKEITIKDLNDEAKDRSYDRTGE